MSGVRWSRVSDGSYQIRVRVNTGMLVLGEVYEGTQRRRWHWWVTGDDAPGSRGTEETMSAAKRKVEEALAWVD